MSHTHKHRPDGNQQEIVDGLRKAGVFVAVTSSVGDGFPDLYVFRPGSPPVYGLMEVKTPGENLNSREREWWAVYREKGGIGWIVFSLDGALQAVGLI